MKAKPKHVIEERPTQDVPSEIVDVLMRAIQNQFYPESFRSKEGAKKWGQEKHFIMRQVVLWPAGWLDDHGITLSPGRYKQIILTILKEIKVFGAGDAIEYFPRYLSKCVQSHFAHNEDAIHDEGKSFRNQLDRALGRIGGQRGPDPVASMAASLKVLNANRRQKTRKADGEQLSLF